MNIGDKFGQLTYLGDGPRKLYGKKRPVMLKTANVRCICGKEYNVIIYHLKRKSTCGCNIRIYDKLNHQEIIELYNQIKNTDKIADMYNVSQPTISKILKKYGISLKNRKYYIDENYFEIINTEEKAYWLGFLAADGCIRLRHGGAEKKLRGSSIILKLAIADEYHLKKFSGIFGGDSRITYQTDYTITRKGNKSRSDNCKVSINSNKLVEDIINKGIIPRKTHTLKKPNINPIWYKDFLRGLFDGDGCITFKTKKGTQSSRDNVIKHAKISIASASIEFKEWLIEYFNEKDIIFKKRGKYEVSNTNIKSMYNFVKHIYKDSTIYLERKKHIADDFIMYYEKTRDDIGGKFYV